MIIKPGLIIGVIPAVVLLAGCASPQPRVVEVTRRERLMTIQPADEAVFAEDRASHIKVRPEPRPAADQGEDFYVSWRGREVTEVRFEYRQLQLPNQIQQQVFTPQRRSSTVFQVRGDAYHRGGKVSAWRVTLWKASTSAEPVASLQSTLW